MADELDFGQEAVKQVLTLSTGVLALSLTFSKDVVGSVPSSQRWPLYTSWCLLTAAVFLSIWCLLAATGERHHARTSTKPKNFRVPWLLQLFTFFAGLGFLVGFTATHIPS